MTCCSREIQCNQIVALRFDIALSGGEGERERERENTIMRKASTKTTTIYGFRVSFLLDIANIFFIAL